MARKPANDPTPTAARKPNSDEAKRTSKASLGALGVGVLLVGAAAGFGVSRLPAFAPPAPEPVVITAAAPDTRPEGTVESFINTTSVLNDKVSADKLGGQGLVQAGAMQVNSLVAKQGFIPALFDSPQVPTLAQMPAVLPYLSEKGKAKMTALLTAAGTGDATAADTVRALVLYGITPSGLTVDAADPQVFAGYSSYGQTIAPEAGDTGRMIISQEFDELVRAKRGSEPAEILVQRSLTVYMSPAPEGSATNWVIDDWDGTVTASVSPTVTPRQ